MSCKETLVYYVLKSEKMQMKSNLNPSLLKLWVGCFLPYFSLASSQPYTTYQNSKLLMSHCFTTPDFLSHPNKINSALISYHGIKGLLILLYLSIKLLIPSFLFLFHLFMLNSYFAEMIPWIPWKTYLINLITSFGIYSPLLTEIYFTLYFIPCHTDPPWN